LIAARSWRTDSRLALGGHVDVPTLHAIILIDSGWRVSQAFNQEYQSSRERGVNLRKAESWDAAVLAAVPDATLIVDRRARIVFASDQVSLVFGYPPGELADRSIDSLLPERSRAAHVGHIAKFFAAPSVRRMASGLTLFGRCKDGTEFPADVALSPVTIDGELYVICSVRNIIEAHAAAQILRQSVSEWELCSRAALETLQMFVEYAPSAVAMLDRELRYLVVSRRWREDYGLTGRELIGRRHYEVFPELPERWREIHKRALAGVPAQAAEDSFVRQDGTIEWVHWDIRPWRTPDGGIGGIMLFTEVITRRVLAEQALRRSHDELEERIAQRTSELEQARAEAVRANELKSRFLSAASHDLRQPLQVATLCISNILAHLSRPEQRAACEDTRQSLGRMAEIINALLDISRLEGGAVQPDVRDFELGPLLQRIASHYRFQSSAKGLRLVVDDCSHIVRSDPQLLERIIDNLISNAIRYTAEGEVLVRAEPDADQLRISVVDTGIGIPGDKQHAIFEEYVQLDNPARDRDKGLGLGLSIVKHIADILGARIELASRPGLGSEFTVRVPLGTRANLAATPQPQEPMSRPTSQITSGQPVILLVEDNRSVAAAMQIFLELRGFQCCLAEHSEGALDLIDGGLRPALIISDYRLPTRDGVWLLRQLRAKLGPVPAILMTGETGVRTEPGEERFYTLLQKPTDARNLSSLLNSLLADPQ
jgi:hypothetical protein